MNNRTRGEHGERFRQQNDTSVEVGMDEVCWGTMYRALNSGFMYVLREKGKTNWKGRSGYLS